MKRILFTVLSLILVAVACSRAPDIPFRFSKTPDFINHPHPDVTVDYSIFEKADGCEADNYGNLTCTPDSPLGVLGCDSIQKTSNLLGGLEPAYPIAFCYILPFEGEGTEPQFPDEGTYFYSDGGLYPRYMRYVIYRDDGFELIHNEAEFKAVFAPVDSENEALSFALAFMNVSAYYGQEADPAYKYDVSTIEDTHVEITGQGYQIQLYDYQFFGCGPHYTYDIDVLVTEQGDVEQVNAQPIFRDPEEDNLCVD